MNPINYSYDPELLHCAFNFGTLELIKVPGGACDFKFPSLDNLISESEYAHVGNFCNNPGDYGVAVENENQILIGLNDGTWCPVVNFANEGNYFTVHSHNMQLPVLALPLFKLGTEVFKAIYSHMGLDVGELGSIDFSNDGFSYRCSRPTLSSDVDFKDRFGKDVLEIIARDAYGSTIQDLTQDGSGLITNLEFGGNDCSGRIYQDGQDVVCQVDCDQEYAPMAATICLSLVSHERGFIRYCGGFDK